MDERNGKRMAHYMTVNGRTFGIGLLVGRVSEVLVTCKRVDGGRKGRKD